MVEIDQRAVDEIVHEGTALHIGELFDILERYHDDRPGIPTAAVAEYARELATRDDFEFDAELFGERLDERRTDATSWVDDERLYELDGDRLSRYPKSWHDRLGGETDPVEFLRFLFETDPPFVRDGRDGRQYVQEDELVDVMRVVGQVDQPTAKRLIEDAREKGTIVEDADQHPRAGVYLAE
jgi:hypothetical protein